MTAQPPSALPSAASKPSSLRPIPRRRNLAVSTAAIPAVILSSVALAQPAAAVQTVAAPTVRQHLPSVKLPAPAALVPASEIAAQVPAVRIPAVTASTSHTVKPGDTISAIARKHGVDMHAVLKLNGMNVSTVIYPGQKIKIRGVAAAAPSKPSAPAAPRSSASASYTVKPGDTLGAIAARHGVSLSSLLAANGLSMNSIIYPGQKITLGGPAAAPAKPTAPSAPAAPAPAPAAGGTYVIKPGDTLGAIAASHKVSLSALLQANGLSMNTVIYPGKKLTIPGRTGTTPAAPAPTDLVPSTFLGVTYPQAVVADANRNKQILNSLPAPTPAEMKVIVANTARSMGVDPSLALAFSYQESGFNQRAVSPANAIGAMQVIPMSGEWASELVGRKLNLLNPQDNATAGVAIIRALLRTSPSVDIAIASYYQGQYSVKTHGMFADTKNYVAAIKAHQKNFR